MPITRGIDDKGSYCTYNNGKRYYYKRNNVYSLRSARMKAELDEYHDIKNEFKLPRRQQKPKLYIKIEPAVTLYFD